MKIVKKCLSPLRNKTGLVRRSLGEGGTSRDAIVALVFGGGIG
jgi:hypothetical protein